MIPYIILAIFLFGLLIAIHEWGHFITAKLFGVKVNEFAIGMGPVLLSKQKGETRYSLRAIPMGGFCAMEGEDEESDSPRTFGKQATWKRLIILFAGAFLNFVVGFLIVLVLFFQVKSFPVPVITDFMDGFPSESQEGLLPGDRILSIDGRKVRILNDVNLYLMLNKSETKDLTILRDGKILDRKDFPLTPREYTVDGKNVVKYGLLFEEEPATPGVILQQSWGTTGYFVRSIWMGFQMLFQGDAGFSDMAGPVGIVSMIGEAGSQSSSVAVGIYNVFYIIALIAINLAVLNLLPIPALDGGRILFLIINKGYHLLTGKDINPKYEAYVHGIGFVLLILLMLIVTFQDVIRLLR